MILEEIGRVYNGGRVFRWWFKGVEAVWWSTWWHLWLDGLESTWCSIMRT